MSAGPELQEQRSPALRRDELEAELCLLELVPYDDPDAAAGPAVQYEHQAAAQGWEDIALRARLVHADVIGRRGDTAGAGSIARMVNAWALEHGNAHLLARSERLLSAFYTRIGDMAAALEHAVRSVELLDEHCVPRLRADHVMALALSLARTRSFDAARDRFSTALRIADETDDVRLRIAALNNLAFVEYWAGNPQASMRVAAQMQLTAERHGIPLGASYLDTVARAQMMLGQWEIAERTLAPVLGDDARRLLTEGDDLAEILLTLAECQRMSGAHDRAQSSLEKAAQLCDERDLQEVMVRVMEEQAQVYAAQGHYRRAYDQHRQFHEASEALYSAERDARARTLQAVFETEEALQSSRRFREMSLRDPLTGLYNRRYVDDRLPALLARAREESTPLSLALADLDHFKRINDSLSHDTGDEVLRQLAPLLQIAAGEQGFAARLGGEEFLVVLPGLDAATAFERCEQLRRDVCDYPWAPIVGELPVTVSLGLVTTFAGLERTNDLLGEADRRLYVSKHEGRDRVTGD